jgi:hypothetical protein
MNENGRVDAYTLKVKNFKCIRQVEIDLTSGDIIQIRGDTAQGKSAVLEATEALWADFVDPEYVRHGADKAEIELRCDEATITRIIPAIVEGDLTRKKKIGTTLVSDPSGKPMQEGVEFLKAIFGRTAFRIVEWVKLGGGDAKGKTERLRQQRDTLLNALPVTLDMTEVTGQLRAMGEEFLAGMKDVNRDGVDYTHHAFIVCDSLRDACSRHLTVVNAMADDAKNRLELVPAPKHAAPSMTAKECEESERVTTEAYHQAKAMTGNRMTFRVRYEELKEKVEAEAENIPDKEKLEATETHYREVLSSTEAVLADLEGQVRAQRVLVEETREKVARCEDLATRVRVQSGRVADLARLKGELDGDAGDVDLEALERAMRQAKVLTESRKAQDAHDGSAAIYVKMLERSKIHKRLVEFFRDDMPRDLIQRAKLPVQGLGVDGDKITIHETPLHLLGTSEQIRIGVSLIAAMNPRCPFLPVDQAESLGREDRIALAQTAKELGLKLIMSFVDADAVPGPGVTVMRDGMAV